MLGLQQQYAESAETSSRIGVAQEYQGAREASNGEPAKLAAKLKF